MLNLSLQFPFLSLDMRAPLPSLSHTQQAHPSSLSPFPPPTSQGSPALHEGLMSCGRDELTRAVQA